VFLKENADIRGKIENTLRKKMNIPIPGAANGAAAAAPAVQAEKPGEKAPLQAAAATASAAANNKPRAIK
jgi:hypothetical protein